MNRFLIALVFVFAACTHPQETPDVKVSASLSGEGKPAAPVDVTAELTPTHARLSVRFEAGADQATLTVTGLDGLTVTQAPASSERSYKPAELAQLDVDYTGASGTLVVNVTGTFNGARKSRVVTFAVGEVKPVSSGTKVTPDNGAPFKALPSGK
jgi:hypothetical protein